MKVFSVHCDKDFLLINGVYGLVMNVWYITSLFNGMNELSMTVTKDFYWLVEFIECHYFIILFLFHFLFF